MTTTANDAIGTPGQTAATMRKLREIGLNTVYVEVWKNGYTQFPSKVLKQTIGVDRRPNLMPQDPSDTPEALRRPARDLLEETLIQAHRNGLVYVAWFEYGFMAAHKSTDNHLRRMKKEWLSLDKDGGEVAPNGFVWMNPLHPEARKFLLDLVLEAIDKYDLDGIQLDDRIVWPYITMGYDAYTKGVYAREHGGKEPPADCNDAEWTRWRADKVNEFSRLFASEVRKRRPGLLVSLSPAVYPWCYDHYCLEWPKWGAWTSGVKAPERDTPGLVGTPIGQRAWDEFVPQCYRMNYKAFEQTWLEQVQWMKQDGAGRVADLIAGVRVVGDGPDATWEDVRSSIELVRRTGGGGHVLWFSRGVMDLYPKQLAGLYRTEAQGVAAHPRFGTGWRPDPVRLTREERKAAGGESWWSGVLPQRGKFQWVARRGESWSGVGKLTVERSAGLGGGAKVAGELGPELKEVQVEDDRVWVRAAGAVEELELLVDRR